MQTIKGSDHEISFWKDFVKSDRFINGWIPDNIKTPDLLQEVADFFLARPDATVLDCGSGVVSILRGTVPDENLTPCDLLGAQYFSLFRDSVYFGQFNIKAPIPIGCEDLPMLNYVKSIANPPPLQFDIVHISNALDHVQNPQRAYFGLMESVKPGGFLVIQGFVNEGMFENWQGMHQHNIDIVDGKLQISDKTGLICSFCSNVHTAKKITLETRKEWFVFIKQKPIE